MSEKFCTDCKWRIENEEFNKGSDGRKQFALCSKNVTRISETILSEEKFCTVQRRDFGWITMIFTKQCGPKARYFEPKETMLAAREGK